MKGKRGIVSEYLPWIIISIAVLVILMIVSFLLKDKGISIIDSIKNLFRRG
ncbi:MAG: hypothetical protein Q8Q04_00450 [archaeon]|nr:hypothetical protein [archaeon]